MVNKELYERTIVLKGDVTGEMMKFILKLQNKRYKQPQYLKTIAVNTNEGWMFITPANILYRDEING